MVVAVLALVLTVVLGGGRQTPSRSESGSIVLVLDRDAFGPGNSSWRGDAFCVLASDADLDGDPDLLVNWHVFAPPALWWNEGGRFRLRTEVPWSLPEHPGVPLLDGAKRGMLRAIAARDEAGVYLWHSDKGAFWNFAFTRLPGGTRSAEAGAKPAPILVIETNRPIVEVAGLGEEAYQLLEERVLRIALTPALSGQRFYFATQEAAIQVKARIEGADLPFFVGPTFVELRHEVEFWARDPHGVAWVDVTGSPAPELYVTRGGLRGSLAPPLDPKFDDFYVAASRPGPFYERVEIPPGYARGREVQWVDLEGDGTLELYVSNKESRNVLLRFDPETLRASDHAKALGLDLEYGDTFVWLDLDGDGDEDLVTLDAREGLSVLRSQEGKGFEPWPALAPGLHLSPVLRRDEPSEEEEESLGSQTEGSGQELDGSKTDERPMGIDQHDLVLLDVENDGDLDLLVSGWGRKGICVLFLAEDEGFVEATARVGLDGVEGASDVVVADFDADAFLDLLFLGRSPRLFRNERGHMRPQPFAGGDPGWAASVGTACDADGDGRIDVVLAGRDLALARNRTADAGAWVVLSLTRDERPPIGALVRATYADGSVHVCRVGSTHRGHLAQSHGPIALACPSENPLRQLEVRFPGGERRVTAVSGPGPVRLEADQ